MTQSGPTDPLRRLLARIAGRGQPADAASPGQSPNREFESPEERLLGIVARYGPSGANEEADARQVSNAAASGVRTVAPTELSDAFAPTWVRRLVEPSPIADEPADVVVDLARPPVG
jgi:hypothetical protein